MAALEAAIQGHVFNHIKLDGPVKPGHGVTEVESRAAYGFQARKFAISLRPSFWLFSG